MPHLQIQPKKVPVNIKVVFFLLPLAILLILFSNITKSATVSSGSYILIETVTAGGTNISSSSYKVDLSIGQPSIGITNSSTYNVSLGRYYAQTVLRYIISISLSRSTAWWNDTLTANGTVTLSSGGPVTSGTVSIFRDGLNLCSANTTASGSYNCTFQAPNELGKFTIVAQIRDNEGNIVTASIDLLVEAEYGETPIGIAERSVFEIPVVVQEPSGKISTPLARITIWKR